MSLKHIGSLTVVALCLAACSSSGSGSGSSNSNNSIIGGGNRPDANIGVSKLVPVSALRASAHEDLNDLAKELSDNDNAQVELSSYSVNVNGKSYNNGNIDLATLGNGFKRINATETATAKFGGDTYSATRNSTIHLYQQPYSVVAAIQNTGGKVTGPGVNENLDRQDFDVNYVQGELTKTLPSTGSFNYKGVAFTETEQGNLDYTINFDTKKGAGSISGINEAGLINLHESDITNVSHQNSLDGSSLSGFGVANGVATSEKAGNGTYKLGIFGPNADEIAGSVLRDNDALVGFGGKKQ